MTPGAGQWPEFESALSQLCEAWNASRFVPLLEADVVGYLYLLLLVRSDGDASCWHLDTRVRGAEAKDKFDLVFGPISSGEERRAQLLQRLDDKLSEDQRQALNSRMFLERLRPAVEASLIVEVKFFATGFTPQQHNVHFVHALEDVARLGTLARACPNGRASLLVDAESYLKVERRKRLIEARGPQGSDLRLYLCEKPKGGAAAWHRLEALV
jgi:hypothetical protein